MPKPNAYLLKLRAEKAAELSYQRTFTTQWCADAAILAANEVFHRSGEKLVEFYNVFIRTAHEIAEMTLIDAQDDKELAYTKEKLDRQLEKLLGENFVPWEVRYGQLIPEKKRGVKR